MAPVREVAFELECFEWADERLEVAGRWKGLGPHRLNRPVLTVETDTGRRKRIVAMPGGHMGVVGETWRASFAWPTDPAEITGAELEVGGNLVVDLPLPDRRRRRRWRATADQHADETLRAEIAALRGQVDRLRAELAGREREIIALHSQLDEETDQDEGTPARAGADERTVEIQRLAGALERLQDEKVAGAEAMTVEIQRLAGEVERLQEEKAAGAGAMSMELERLAAERDAARADADALAAERERWRADVDELRQAFAEAAAEAEDTRDRHRTEVAALEEQLRAERAAVARMSTELASRAEAAAALPTEATPPHEAGDGQPTQAMPPPGESSTGAPDEAMPPPGESSAGAPTEAMPPPGEPSAKASGGPLAGGTAAAFSSAPAEGVTIEAAVLDAPGPLRAGSRPPSPPGREDDADSPIASGVPPDDTESEATSAFHALKARFEGLFASNGNPHDRDDAVEEPAVPRPLRTAAAARARAGATVAARRSPGEVWALRVLALVVVAVLLTAFVLILAYIA
jgi:predicted  nucleic acid-binding Zn-ribbon protein